MLLNLLLLVYAIAAGFVSAGCLASLYQLVTDRQPGFVLASGGFLPGTAAIFVCIFAGPFIIMRNAIRGRRVENRPIGWLAASSAIAAGWSLCSGILVIELALVLRDSIV